MYAIRIFAKNKRLWMSNIEECTPTIGGWRMNGTHTFPEEGTYKRHNSEKNAKKYSEEAFIDEEDVEVYFLDQDKDKVEKFKSGLSIGMRSQRFLEHVKEFSLLN